MVARGKVQLDAVRQAARRALGGSVAVSDYRGRFLDEASVVVRLDARQAVVFEGRSIQGARRLALQVLGRMGEQAAMIERRTVTCPRVSVQIHRQSDQQLAVWVATLREQGFDLSVAELRAKVELGRANGMRIVPLCPEANPETGECPGHFEGGALSVAEVS